MDERYLGEVHERLHPRWSTFLEQLGRIPAGSPYHDASLSVDVVMAVEPDGAISRAEVTRATGLKGFDEAPIDLTRDVARLPAPPRELASDDGKVYLQWRFQRRAPGCEVSSVVERRLPLDQAIPALVQAGHVEEAVSRVEEASREDPAQTHHLLLALTDQLGRVGATDRDPRRRAAAAAILGNLDGAEPELMALLSEENADVRQAALAALAERPRSEAAVVAMLAALDVPSDRPAAIRALGRLGDAKAILPLRELLATGVAPEESATALVALGDRSAATQVAMRLLVGEAPTRLAGAQAAKPLAQPALLPALEAVASDRREEVRAAAIEAIGAIGERAVEARPSLLRALSDPSARVRAQAATAALQVDPRGAAVRVRLIDALSDEDASVRAAAGAGLARCFGDSEDIAWELWRLARDRAPSVRVAIGEALAQHPARASAFVLAKLRHDPDRGVQQAIELAVVGEATTSPVQALLSSPDTVELLRAAAAWRAAEMGAPRAKADRSNGG